jgi:arylsulfatase A-like enzyme
VPAIVRFPGQVPAGVVTAEPVTAMDLFTTLAHACGVEVPADRPIDGIDISEVIRGQPSRHPARTFYWALPNATGKEFAYREGDWKLLLDSSLRPIELFDLKRDPLELINRLAAEPARVADLTAKFKAHHAAVLADPLRPKDMNQSNH